FPAFARGGCPLPIVPCLHGAAHRPGRALEPWREPGPGGMAAGFRASGGCTEFGLSPPLIRVKYFRPFGRPGVGSGFQVGEVILHFACVPGKVPWHSAISRKADVT